MLSSFLVAIMDRRQGVISPKRFGDALHMPLADVARLAKVHRNTLARTPNSPVVQERLGQVARIITAAADLVDGDTGRAVIWVPASAAGQVRRRDGG